MDERRDLGDYRGRLEDLRASDFPAEILAFDLMVFRITPEGPRILVLRAWTE
jgi:hypothetical protein